LAERPQQLSLHLRKAKGTKTHHCHFVGWGFRF
jgi:hypothetical protein